MRGDHPLQINWTKNGMDLGNRDNNTYIVFQVTLDDSGFYGCTAKNWAGKAYAFFWIDVTGKKILKRLAKKYGQNRTESFDCPG